MSRYFRLQVDPEELTDEMFAFVTDPHPSRNERPIVQELHDARPETVDVLEAMLLDGTEDRQDVADYVAAVFGTTPPDATDPETAPTPREPQTGTWRNGLRLLPPPPKP